MTTHVRSYIYTCSICCRITDMWTEIQYVYLYNKI